MFVQDGEVAVAEQLSHEGGRSVPALELQFEDAVELELLDADEVGPREAVPEHHREVRRAARGVGHVVGRGDVGLFHVAEFDDELDAPPVEVPHLEPDEVVVRVEIGLVEFGPRVLAEFGL